VSCKGGTHYHNDQFDFFRSDIDFPLGPFFFLLFVFCLLLGTRMELATFYFLIPGDDGTWELAKNSEPFYFCFVDDGVRKL
jgi:hypothetical protein